MPAFVQVVCSGTAGSAASTQVLTVAANTTAGHMLSLAVRTSGGKTLSSVSDTQGNTWHVDEFTSGASVNAALASCILATALTLTGNGGGADQITLHFSASCIGSTGVTEYSGVASTGSPALATVDQAGSVTAFSGLSTSVATTANSAQGSDLVVSALATSTVTSSATVTSSDPDSGGTWTQPSLGINAVGQAYEVGGGSVSEFSATWTSGSGSTTISLAVVAYSPGSSGVSGAAVPAGAGSASATAAVAAPAAPAGAGSASATAAVRVTAALAGGGALSGVESGSGVLLLVNSFEEGTDGTTLTGGPGSNTTGSGVNYLDSVSIGTNATLAFSSAFAAHGGLAAKIATGATPAASYMEWSTQVGTVTTLYGRAYLNLSGAPAAGDAFIQFQSGSGTFAAGIQITTARQLLIQNAAFTFVRTFNTVLATATWYRVEWELVSGASAGALTVNLYAWDSLTLIEGYTTAAGNYGPSCDAVLVGWTGSHASQPAVYVDDVGLSSSGFMGPAVGSMVTATAGGSGTLAASPGVGIGAALAGSGAASGAAVARAAAVLAGAGTMSGTTVAIPGGEPAFVQVVASGLLSSSATQVLTVTAAGLAGDMLSAVVRTSGGKTLSSVSDTQGNTWHVDVAVAGAQTNVSMASCVPATPLTLTGNGGGADQITLHFSGVCTAAAGITEYSGVASSGQLATVDQAGSSTDVAGLTSTVATTSGSAQGWDLVISGMGTSSVLVTSTVTPSDPDSGGTWTQPSLGGVLGVGVAFEIGSAVTGEFSATWTCTVGASNQSSAIVAYAPSGLGPSAQQGTAALAGSGTAAVTPAVLAAAVAGGAGGLTGGTARGQAAALAGAGAMTATASVMAAAPRFLNLRIDGGGNVNVFDISPGGVFIGGSDVQGLYRSSDNGDHWAVVNTGVGAVSVSISAVLWSVTETNTCYAFSGDAGSGGGMMASTDNGYTWAMRAPKPQFAGNHRAAPLPNLGYARSKGRLATQDSSYLFAATYNQGVLRSANNGVDNFPTACTMAGSAPGTGTYFCTTLEQDPASSTTLYVGMYDYDGTGTYGHVWKTTTGHSATPDFTQLTASPAIVEDLRMVGTYLYAAAGTAGVFRSTDGGTTWTNLNGSGIGTSGNYWASVEGYVDGSGNHVIYAGDSNAQVAAACIVSLTIPSSWPGSGSITYANQTGSVQSATVPPDGRTWWHNAPGQFQDWLGTLGYNAGMPFLIVNATNLAAINWYCIGADGLCRNMAGAGWTIANNGMAAFVGRSVAADPSPSRPGHMVCGFTDHGAFDVTDGIAYDASTTVNDAPISSEEGFACAFDPTDSTTYFAMGAKGNNNTGTIWYRPWNALTSWTTTSFDAHAGGKVALGLCGLRDGNHGNAQTVVAAVWNGGIWRGQLSGSTWTWTQVTATFMNTSSVTGQATEIVNVPGSPYVYCFDRSNGVYRSNDYGITWVQVWGTSDGSVEAGGLAADPTTPGRIWVTNDNGLYKITGAHTGVIGSGAVLTGPFSLPGSGTAGSVGVLASGTVVVVTQDGGAGSGIWTSPTGSVWTDGAGDGSFGAANCSPRRMAISSDGRVYVTGVNIVTQGYPLLSGNQLASAFLAGGGAATATATVRPGGPLAGGGQTTATATAGNAPASVTAALAGAGQLTGTTTVGGGIAAAASTLAGAGIVNARPAIRVTATLTGGGTSVYPMTYQAVYGPPASIAATATIRATAALAGAGVAAAQVVPPVAVDVSIEPGGLSLRSWAVFTVSDGTGAGASASRAQWTAAATMGNGKAASSPTQDGGKEAGATQGGTKAAGATVLDRGR